MFHLASSQVFKERRGWAQVTDVFVSYSCDPPFLPSCLWGAGHQDLQKILQHPGIGTTGPPAGQAHRVVDLHAVTVPSGFVYTRYSITAEGVIGDFQVVREVGVVQEDSRGEFLWEERSYAQE